MAQLDARLTADGFVLGQFPLCYLIMENDANYPWFILVPNRDEVTEIYQLSDADQQQLMRESSVLSVALAEAFHADKMNVAALGNVVPQLHLHHIVRYQGDAAWPAPIWNAVDAKPYLDEERDAVIALLKQTLPEDFVWAM